MKQKIDFNTAYGKCLIKAWSDPQYKKDFVKNPRDKFAAEGYSFPKDTKVVFHTSTPNQIHLTFPPKSRGKNISTSKGAVKPEFPEFVKAYGKCVAKAWADPKYKAELIQNPREKILSEGYQIPSKYKVEIHESTLKERHYAQPPKPSCDLSTVNPEDIGSYAWLYL